MCPGAVDAIMRAEEYETRPSGRLEGLRKERTKSMLDVTLFQMGSFLSEGEETLLPQLQSAQEKLQTASGAGKIGRAHV